MASRAAGFVCFAVLMWPAGSLAEQTNAIEPVERLSCEDVFDRDDVSQAYVERIVSFAFSGDEDARLAKWTNGLRIVVRAEASPQDFVLDAILGFRGELPHVRDFEAIAQIDSTNHARFKDGDLLVYLTWHRGMDGADAKQRYGALLQEFYESYSAEDIHAVIGSEKDTPFVGVVRGAGGDVRRAIVVMDLDYAQIGKQPAVLQFLTTAINPNQGNAAYLGLPGSTPAEKRIYEKTWRSKVAYDLSWTLEFRVYLELLLQRQVTPGIAKAQFTDAVRLILDQPRMKRRLAFLYDCKSTGD